MSTKKKVNNAEERKEVQKLPDVKFEKSFASVTLPTKHVCQTDLTWLTKDKPQLISNKNLPSSKKKAQCSQTSTSQTQTRACEEPNLMGHSPISKGKKL